MKYGTPNTADGRAISFELGRIADAQEARLEETRAHFAKVEKMLSGMVFLMEGFMARGLQ